ncbi:MAG: [protein-PII] uridylyltransferase [Pseudomonadota bacterium]|nr:[protein-PII] uridylyltransferase [Pseudomonadota bacterium]
MSPIGASLAFTQRLPTGWRQQLKAERSSLKEQFLQSGDVRALLHGHSRLVDQILQVIWIAAELPATYAFVAVGGYGRGELFPYSDIDVLILSGDTDQQPPEKIEQLVGTLWDVGLEVGHSVRNVQECVTESAGDITVQTTLREARLLAGRSDTFAALQRLLEQRHNVSTFYAAKTEEQRKRHRRYNETSYSLEPNLKESPGGLRDLQNILWLANSAKQGSDWAALAQADLIAPSEARQIRRHEHFLKDLRIRLHYLADRREDRLLFDFQERLAEQLGLQGKGQKRPSEMLMQRYYQTTKVVRFLNTILLHNISGRIHPLAPLIDLLENPDFQVRGDVLRIRDEQLYQDKPETLFETFRVLQRRPELTGLSPTTLRALWRAKNRMDADFRRNPMHRAQFIDILRAPLRVTYVLRRMNEYGLLGAYIPAFGRIVGQMQHDLFHVYTVDQHILIVLRNVRRFALPMFAHEFPFCSALSAEFERPEVLYLAALFHDIAKGRGGDHSRLGALDARRFCKAHDLSQDDCDLVVWLVESHLVMSATAQKQDLSDPKVVERFAKRVGNLRRLTALYLITVADIRGTSPKVWNAWKGKLLEDLYRLTKHFLDGATGNVAAEIAVKREEALRIIRQYALPDDQITALWEKLDDSYFRRHEAQEIAWHARTIRRRIDIDGPIIRARLSPVGEGVQVMVYTPDRAELFARISGFFGRMSFNIIEAKIYTTLSGYALDSFYVLDRAKKDSHYRDLLSYIEHELNESLARNAPLPIPVRTRVSRQVKHFPIAPEVELSPDERAGYRTLSIVAGDRPGLLYAIAYIFVRHAILLHNAKINTLGERAEDIFMISGDALADPERCAAFLRDITEQL